MHIGVGKHTTHTPACIIYIFIYTTAFLAFISHLIAQCMDHLCEDGNTGKSALLFLKKLHSFWTLSF